MATFFRNKVVKEVGTEAVKALETNGNTRSTIIGLSLANLTDNAIFASVSVLDDTDTLGYFMKDVIVPPNSSLRALSAGEKLILAPNNELYVEANNDASLDAVISYVDIV